MNRIDDCFARCRQQGRAALVPFITAGDPGPEQTLALMHAMVEAGADIIELGIPFSDPMADGPTIQLACERALAAGMNLPRALAIVREFRARDSQTPVVLMGYLNPIEAMGESRFAEAAKAAGADGVLSVDLAVEETDTLVPALREAGLAPIFLVAPTTSDKRIRDMDAAGQGYLYYVSLKGVTGSAALDVGAVSERLSAMRSLTDLPLAVGFGIREPKDAAAVAKDADAVIVGSALVEIIAANAQDHDAMIAAIHRTVSALSEAIAGARTA